MQPKVTLIVTVYNKEPYLRRCLDSIERQTNHSAEIIVVDDASTDGSSNICDEYCEKNKWLVIHHAVNKGVSEARNIGLTNAKGDYVTFLDADDVLLPRALETMEKVSGRGYNIYQFCHQRCRRYDIRSPKFYGAQKGNYDLYFIPKYWVLVWNKLYKREFLTKNRIRFKKNMQFGEDTLFNAKCILANNGLYHAPQATVIHCLDDKKSLCRKGLEISQLELLNNELRKLADKQTDIAKIKWMNVAINEHINSKLFMRLGFNGQSINGHDIVYFVKDEPSNEELRYSLRSVEEYWQYRNVWFCGGCPDGLKPDKLFNVKQEAFVKWDRVRDMITKVCENDDISENFWLFNDDFFILKPMRVNMPAQYNGELMPYIEYVEKKHGGVADGFTIRLRQAYDALTEAGLTTYNYEVHKPMLINRKKALEILKLFPDVPCFRSLYGNYYKIGGEDKHDMKIKIMQYKKMIPLQTLWDFVSTSDESFEYGNIGEFLRQKFNKKSRFEK